MEIHISQIEYTERKWGSFLKFTENENTTVKLLEITKGQSISYQYHNHRSEQWYVISGRIVVTKGIETSILIPKMSCMIDRGEKHKLEALGDSLVLEISRGYFDEKDITRIQ